jgi:hypothetical protein
VVVRLAALPCALVERSGRGMYAPGGERHLNVFHRHQRLRQVACREGDAGRCVPGERLPGPVPAQREAKIA